ncbi:hypothetical protein [Leucobacter musarum]|uniref:hypothetical protein n=1 Tax=Leucobacter musarum TaxID=1930747 RepID=UPI0006A7817C|nr:hypothetical protein [Leucobacter musarum]
MMRRIGLLSSGIVLVALFLLWMVLKGNDPMRSWIADHQELSLVAWGLAWVCALGGAALIARATRRPPVPPATQADVVG